MIRGKTKNIAIPPIPNKKLDPKETFIPFHIDIRNGHLTDAGNWEKRPGYALKWDTGTNRPIKLLIPENRGYAVSDYGDVYQLDRYTTTSTYKLSGKRLTGTYRPTWTNHRGWVIVCDGGNPARIDESGVSFLGGYPVYAKFVDTIDGYVLMSGHNDYDFVWSAVENSENWPAVNFNSVLKEGDAIQMMKVLNRKVYFFKKYSIEIWNNIGGTSVFARSSIVNVLDKVARQGSGIAGHSVVQANNTFYFYADGDFYALNGITPIVISKHYRKELDKLEHANDIFGFDCRKENAVRWLSQKDGKCFKYDYSKGYLSEDNTWAHGQFERLPWNSYMELNGEQYFGDYDQTGKIYHWSYDYNDDLGKEISVYRKFALTLSSNGNSSRVNLLRFRIKRGVATNGEKTPHAFVKWRFDQDDWELPEFLDLGVKGNYDPYLDIHNLGIGREMEIEITETDAVDYLLTHAYLTSEVLGN
jgi:hypothetical protein